MVWVFYLIEKKVHFCSGKSQGIFFNLSYHSNLNYDTLAFQTTNLGGLDNHLQVSTACGRSHFRIKPKFNKDCVKISCYNLSNFPINKPSKSVTVRSVHHLKWFSFTWRAPTARCSHCHIEMADADQSVVCLMSCQDSMMGRRI